MRGQNDKPSRVPSEEEIARVVDADSWRHLDEARSTVVEPFIEAMERCVEPSLVTARAVLALFDAAIRERDGWVTHWQTKCQATRALELAAEARALAAEAALAAERERCLAIVEAQVPEWAKQRSGPYWDGYREAMEDAADDIRKGAAAIRAQGCEMKVSGLLIVATLLAGSDARSETILDKLARTGGLIMGYEVACAANHGSLGQQVVERLQKRAELAGYSFMNPDFMDLINIHAKQSIAGFKSDAGQLCLQTKSEIDKIMRGDGP